MEFEKQILKPIYAYFDMYFEDSYLGYDDKGWYGVMLGDELLIGRPLGDDDDTWYYDGTRFTPEPNMFGVDRKFLNVALKDYVNEKYGLKINKVI